MAAYTVKTTAGYSAGLADIAAEAVAASDTFVNDGRTIAIVTNGSGGEIDVTVSMPATSANFGKTNSMVLAVANAKVAVLGPFPPEHFGTTVTVTYEATTSVTCSILSLTPPE